MSTQLPDLDLSHEIPATGADPVDDPTLSAWADTDEPADSVWRIEDDEHADTAGRRWARAQERLNELEAQRDALLADIEAAAQAQTAKVEAWFAAEAAKPTRDARFYRQTLESWIGRIRDASNGRTKSKRLPAVWVRTSSRPAAARKNPDDENANEKLVAWLRSLGPAGREAIRVVPAQEMPDMAKVKRLVTIDGEAAVDPATGEVVPGLVVAPESTTTTLEPITGDEQ